jgi:hypothetical protein
MPVVKFIGSRDLDQSANLWGDLKAQFFLDRQSRMKDICGIVFQDIILYPISSHLGVGFITI